MQAELRRVFKCVEGKTSEQSRRVGRQSREEVRETEAGDVREAV